MSSSSPLLQCYNISCGKTYLENENNDSACQYHSGRPYFHDGYKEWTCCKMRSRDFSTFMNFKGCTKGKHSNVKPEQIEQKSTSSETKNLEKIDNDGNNNNTTTTTTPQPPPTIDPNNEIIIKINESKNVETAPPAPKSIMICKNCKNEQSTLNMNDNCYYHKGVQIFHDSYKYWSCCPQKKFSDFDECQKLTPCSKTDQHVLIPKIDYKENWFQTNDGSITIALYGLKGIRLKSCDDQKFSSVKLLGNRNLSAKLINHDGLIVFEKQWQLYDYVCINNDNDNDDGGNVQINVSNVQITLKKFNKNNHWPKLEINQ